MRNRTILSAGLILGVFAAAAATAKDKDSKPTAMTKCEMTYSLSGWSAFYKTGKGTGTITCDNGQKADVKIKIKGGGLTFGKSEIVDGTGNFSELKDIHETFGSYASGGAHAGAVKSSGAMAMTKGEISLALAGTGRGWDLGIDFGKFTISAK